MFFYLTVQLTANHSPRYFRPAMFALPILNVRLQACPADWQQMAPTATGRHCAHCDREVVDFTRATAADLAAARAAAPDGRLCGRFRQSQLAAAPPPRLRPRLRRFLVALMLVCGLGLTSREALAQMRAGAKAAVKTESADLSKSLKSLPALQQSYELPSNISKPIEEQVWMGLYVEQMPEYKDGGMKGLLQFIAQNIHYPIGQHLTGRVFVSFIVTQTGNVRDAHVVRSLSEPFDAEALRVISLMGKWIPGEQNGRPVDVSFTLPIKFSNDSQPAVKTKRRK